MKRYEFREGTSQKFWEIEQSGKTVVTRYGRLGGKPQQATKVFGSSAEASAWHAKLVREKVGKGYVAVGSPRSKAPAQAEEPLGLEARLDIFGAMAKKETGYLQDQLRVPHPKGKGHELMFDGEFHGPWCFGSDAKKRLSCFKKPIDSDSIRADTAFVTKLALALKPAREVSSTDWAYHPFAVFSPLMGRRLTSANGFGVLELSGLNESIAPDADWGIAEITSNDLLAELDDDEDPSESFEKAELSALRKAKRLLDGYCGKSYKIYLSSEKWMKHPVFYFGVSKSGNAVGVWAIRVDM